MVSKQLLFYLTMIIVSILALLLSNAVNLRRDISILFNRIAMIILIYCILNDLSSLTVITKGVGIHGGLLLVTNITQIFHIFIFLISILILTLTSFFRVCCFNYKKKWLYSKIINKKGEVNIIEYPLIILFVITGSILLMSSNDLVWATVRVYLELLIERLNSSVERTKDYWTYPESAMKGGQIACSKRDYETTFSLSTHHVFKSRRVPKSFITEKWIKLNCWRSSNYGLIMTSSRTENLLEYLIRRVMETSTTAISYGETLRIALQTSYERLSRLSEINNTNKVRYATGEVSGYYIPWDGRGFVVPKENLGKGPKYLSLDNQMRSYTTRSEVKKLAHVSEQDKDFQTLAKHWWICHNNHDRIFKDLGGLIKLENIWWAAYVKLKKNKGSKTAGPDHLNISDLTKARILEVRDAVIKQTYVWGGIRQVMIPKTGKPGQFRPLGIPTINDRLVQEVIRTIIEPIFELTFNNQSHGFRPNRSCHTALKWINTHMKGMSWFIEGDIKSYFPTIHHNTLMNLIESRIKDRKILNLIRTGLKAKIFTNDKQEIIPELGTPQGGILSPLLSNIYLDQLDLFMERISTEYNTNTRRKRNQDALRLLNKGSKSKYYGSRTPFYVPNDVNHIKIKYIRYADDFLISVVGSRKLAEEIREKVDKFLDTNLKVKLSLEKTHITHISKGIPFLGYKIERRTLFIKQRYNGKRRNRKMTIPLLSVDLKRVVNRLALGGYCTKGGAPLPAFKFLQLPQSETNRKINYILRGLSEWWKIAGNRRRAVAWISYILKTSIVMMYAAKFKLKTTAAVFKIGGDDLSKPIGKRAKSVIGNDEKNVPKANALQGLLYSRYHKIPKPESNNISAKWKPEYMKILDDSENSDKLIKYIRKQESSKSKNPIVQLGVRLRTTISAQGAACLICGTTEDVQMHHTKALKKVKSKSGIKRHIQSINIPQIPLCREHHLEVHQGNWRNNPIKVINKLENETK